MRYKKKIINDKPNPCRDACKYNIYFIKNRSLEHENEMNWKHNRDMNGDDGEWICTKTINKFSSGVRMKLFLYRMYEANTKIHWGK